ncbi:MAG: hypothetical protein JNJ77_02895 [Planctomycetia bacterium]|nr:hypothetical protein [Planctomycetia bacterium]
MSRRFQDYPWQSASMPIPDSNQEMPAFSAISIQAASPHVQQAWQALYHAAWAHAAEQALKAAKPTRYQRLVYQICLN